MAGRGGNAGTDDKADADADEEETEETIDEEPLSQIVERLDATVFGLIGRVHRYPDSLGYEAEFKAIVQSWRPELGD